MVTLYSLQPYASYVVAKVLTPNPATRAADLRTLVEAALRPTAGWLQQTDLTPTIPNTPGLAFAITVQEARPVAWAVNLGPSDSLNHLIVGFVNGDFAAIYVSDPDLKSMLQDALVKRSLTNCEPVEEKLLTQCY